MTHLITFMNVMTTTIDAIDDKLKWSEHIRHVKGKLCNMFTRNNEIHSHGTRHRNDPPYTPKENSHCNAKHPAQGSKIMADNYTNYQRL